MKQGKLDITYAHESALIIVSLQKTLDKLSLGQRGQSHKIATLIEQLDKHLPVEQLDKYLPETPESDELVIWRVVLTGLRTLHSQLRCLEIAIDDSGDILRERGRLSELCSELRRQLFDYADSSNVWVEEIFERDGQSINVEQLLSFFRSTPIPLTYWKRQGENLAFRRPPENKDAKASSTSLVRVIAFIDDEPLVTPQLLQPNLMYSLRFLVWGTNWRDESEKLKLDLITTCPPTDYSVSEFYLQKPSKVENDQYEGELSGQIQFKMAQTFSSENISFVIGCAFELLDGSYDEIPVIGHNQLEFRVLDPAQYSFSGYPRLDQYVTQLIHQLVEEFPSIRDELPILRPVLNALTSLLGAYAQDAVFKDTVEISEKDLQTSVLRDLRLKLGKDVQKHPSQAGGNTDIYYRGVVIELKVERENGNRDYICQRYTKQPTQYEGVEARQVCVLLVLDLTLKKNPPGDIRNDIHLVNVPTHGGEDEEKMYPSKAFVFIVNGNMQDPSAYSKG